MKYVIVQKAGSEVAVLGCDFMEHNDLKGNSTAIAAGQCRIKVINNRVRISVWGKSTTLGLDSRDEDAQVILDTINFSGA